MTHLIAQNLILPDAQFEVLYGGRTNQVWKILGDESDIVLKLYCSDFENPLFRNDARAEADCLAALRATGIVPNLRAAGSYETYEWVIYDHAPGTTWSVGTEQVGRLLAKLHSISVPVDLPLGCNGSADLERHAARILADCRSDRKAALVEAKPRNNVAPLKQRVLIHGDPVPGNILVSAWGATLIDWQCPVFGDPCEDLAIFLSPAMQQVYRGAPLTFDEVQEFFNSYGNHEVSSRYQALRPWFSWRMAAYCLWRAENGSGDYAIAFEQELKALNATNNPQTS